MPKEQLSLLLGVAQASDFKVAGLVSRSVLIASNSAALANAGKAIHLETQLNQTIINELLVEDGKLRVVRSTPLPACGLLALQERCVSAIASAFIQQTRFDPRRSAGSEQDLYNKLPGILATLRERGEASVDIDGHRSRITASALASASERLIKGLEQSRQTMDVPILLDPELHLLPGMEALKGETNTLPANALWEAFIAQREHVELPGEDLHLVDQLAPLGSEAKPRGTLNAAPSDTSLSTSTAVESGVSQGNATHVLVGTLALPLRDEQVPLTGGFSLRRSNGHWTLHGDGGLINGMPSTPQQPLSLGDTLSLGTAGHGRLIEVQS
jgi:hypothetical protein